MTQLNRRIIQNSQFSGWIMDQESVTHSKQVYLGLPSAMQKFGSPEKMVALGYGIIEYKRYVLFGGFAAGCPSFQWILAHPSGRETAVQTSCNPLYTKGYLATSSIQDWH